MPSAQELHSEHTRSFIVSAIGLYAGCSSTLLVLNKVAMYLVPNASLLLFIQFCFVVSFCRVLKLCYPEVDVEPLKWEKVKPFAVAVVVFYICLLSNNKALKGANVESVIVVRSCSPIAVAALDYLALGRDLPNPLGCFSLLAIVSGATIFVISDEGFRIEDSTWLCVYFVFIVIEMVFVKFVVDTVPMSTWTRVYYNSALSIPMTILSGFLTGDLNAVSAQVWTSGAVAIVSVSCIVGVGIGYSGFNLRKAVSATTFTVVGVVCKIFTVLINDLIWSQHSNLAGHVGLTICLASGFLYERSKNTGSKAKKSHKDGLVEIENGVRDISNKVGKPFSDDIEGKAVGG